MDTLDTHRQYDGYLATPFLWYGNLDGLEMLEMDGTHKSTYPEIDKQIHIRLGKLIEYFVLFELEQNKRYKTLQSNIQIFQGQITIGELDAIIKQSEKVVHLEIVYKFYLYDPSIPVEMNRWIGPNRKDSFVEKLNKLKNKQLPLINHPETIRILSDLDVDLANVIQKVCFKAQLFVPYLSYENTIPIINNACINGFYIHFSDIVLFEDCAFHIPEKLDWLTPPHLEVEWISNTAFEKSISLLLASKKSPLCWMKTKDSKLQKFFVVWWV